VESSNDFGGRKQDSSAGLQAVDGGCPGGTVGRPRQSSKTDASEKRSGKASREKGKRGEREAANLIRDWTGWDIRRRVRQHDGDSDLEGVPGWSVEVKNVSKPTLGMVAQWVSQAQEQANGLRWVLVYKRQPGQWRAVWEMEGIEVEASLLNWCKVARGN
jgi:hypothetical protein